MLVCNITSHEEPTFVIMLTVNFGGVLLAVISIACVVANTSIDQSLRGILLSFSIANFIGTGMLTYDSLVLICYGDHTRNFAVTITMTLSVTHLVLLILAEYIALTTTWKQRARDHTGLLLISWIISVTFGSMNVVTIGPASKIGFAVLFVVAILLMLKSYVAVMKKHKKKKCLLDRYKKAFLKQNKYGRKVLKRSWKIKLLGIIIFSYAVCSAPWAINELWEGFDPSHEDNQGDTGSAIFHTVGLIIYSTHFYFPCSICIYLRYIQRKITSEWKLRSYRYRDTLV